MVKKKSSITKTLEFRTAFKYPFNRMKGLLNILWVLLPILGWFALGGYGVRIVQEFTKGQFKKLPIFKFSSDMKLGFFMFIKAIPFILVYMIILAIVGAIGPWTTGLIRVFLEFFVLPILTVNFINKMTVGSFFELSIINSVFANLGEYIIMMLKSILLFIIFIFMSIILIGIPGFVFTEHIFMANFYRKHVKKK